MTEKYDVICDLKVGDQWWESVWESNLSKSSAEEEASYLTKLWKKINCSNRRKPRIRVMIVVPEKSDLELREWWNQLASLERDVLLCGTNHGLSEKEKLAKDRAMYYEWATTKHPLLRVECKHVKSCEQRIFGEDCGLCRGLVRWWDQERCFRLKMLNHQKDKEARQPSEWKKEK